MNPYQIRLLLENLSVVRALGDRMVEILYEDAHIIVVVKPVGMPSQKDLTKDLDLYSEVLEYVNSEADKKQSVTLGLVQRLDRPVGGVMVLSKSKEAHKYLTKMMKLRQLKKTYLAVVEGEAKDSITLNNYIKKVRGNRAIVSNKKADGSKEAILSYSCIGVKNIEGRMESLLSVNLVTGRHHQIRAQLSHNRLPIVGDTKYNAHYSHQSGWFDIGLYAYSLELLHPVTGVKMRFDHVNRNEPFNNFIEDMNGLADGTNECNI